MFAIIINIIIHYWNKAVESREEPGHPAWVHNTSSIPLQSLQFNPNTHDGEIVDLQPPINQALRVSTPPPESLDWEASMGDIDLAQ